MINDFNSASLQLKLNQLKKELDKSSKTGKDNKVKELISKKQTDKQNKQKEIKNIETRNPNKKSSSSLRILNEIDSISTDRKNVSSPRKESVIGNSIKSRSNSPKKALIKEFNKEKQIEHHINTVSALTKEKCTNCLLYNKIYFNFSCKHKICENCFLLNITNFVDDTIATITDNNDTSMSNLTDISNNLAGVGSSPLTIFCMLCLKGKCNVLLSTFLNKKVSETQKSTMNKKCEGCTSSNGETLLLSDNQDESQFKNSIIHCIECNISLCELCKLNHNSILAFKSHSLVNINNNHNISVNQPLCKCLMHNKLNFNCTTCNIKICRECVILQHMDHDFYYLKEGDDHELNSNASKPTKLNSGKNLKEIKINQNKESSCK